MKKNTNTFGKKFLGWNRKPDHPEKKEARAGLQASAAI
jgi:hypothetical protein